MPTQIGSVIILNCLQIQINKQKKQHRSNTRAKTPLRFIYIAIIRDLLINQMDFFQAV